MGDRRVLVARVIGLFGVSGEVKLHSYTEPREQLLRYRPWILRQGATEQIIERPQGRAAGKHVLARLPDAADRDHANDWLGAEIWIDRQQLPRAKRREYYWADLEGLVVSDMEGRTLGTVSHLFQTGSNDVLVLQGERERLIPFVLDDVIKEVDLEARTMRVDWDHEF